MIVVFLIYPMFRRPHDRVFLMFLDLQLLVNFALVHVTLPANVEIAAQIFKPYVSWQFFDNKGIFVNQTESYSQSESHFEEFGQLHTFGYDTYSFLNNIGFLAIIFLLYLVKVAFILLLISFSICCKKNKEALTKWYKSYLEQVVFDDILGLYARALLEFGAALIVSMQTPTDAYDFNFANFLFVAFNAGVFFVVLPYAYYTLLKDDQMLRLKPNKFDEIAK